jgi:hypothetical protein
MFGDLKLELGWNFQVPHVLGVLIHLKMPKSETPTKKIWVLVQKRLNLDVWWFETGAMVEFKGPPRIGGS